MNRENTNAISTIFSFSPKDNSSIDLTDFTINASGTAIDLKNGELSADGLHIEVSGATAYGIYSSGTSRIDLKNSEVNSQYGAISVNGSSTSGSVQIDNSRLTTQQNTAHALNLSNTEASLQNSTLITHGQNAYALNSDRAKITLTGDTFSTSGELAFAAWFWGQSAKITDSIFRTTGAGAIALRSSSDIDMELSTLSTRGNDAAALNLMQRSLVGRQLSIDTTGERSHGMQVGTVGTRTRNTLTLTNSSIHTQGTHSSGLAAFDTSSSVELNDVQISAEQAQAIAARAANLNLTLTDSQLLGGNGQVLTAENGSQVKLQASHSVLAGDVLSDTSQLVNLTLNDRSQLTGAIINATQLDLDDSSTWHITGDSNLQTLNTAGTIAFDHNGSFHTLTVDGDYTGNDAHLSMNGALAGDGSPTDTLIVKGDVQAGTTQVSVNNLGGQGAQTQDGIELISVGGTSHGEFVKEGRIVAGAYDYDIVKRGENWYLDSALDNSSIPWTPIDPAKPVDPSIPWTPLEPADPVDPDPKPAPKEHAIRPEGGIYAANLAAANTLFNTRLQDRQGGTQYLDEKTGEVKVSPLWMRSSVGRTRSHDSSNQLHISGQRSVMQFGSDLGRWTLDGTDSLRVGVMGGYANQKNRSKNARTGYHADGSIYGYSAGVYGTWFQNAAEQTGAYVDSWAQYSWFTAAIKGQDIAPEHYNAKGATASVESGYTWQWDSADANRRYRLQPQAQVTWMGVKADDHREANGTHVASRGNDSVQTRLGLRASVQNFFQTDDGTRQSYEPYAEVNWLNNSRDLGATMDNVRVNQDGARNIAEVKLGIEGQVTQRVSLWGNLAQQMGSNNYRDTGATLGVKVEF
ncbi:MAG: Outer membrane protein IcsA autotransporter [Pseudomonas citronellolis]|nr:MAG: Outer membrane protein IcsA autotransporter [Pseudomonas citronellolis]